MSLEFLILIVVGAALVASVTNKRNRRIPPPLPTGLPRGVLYALMAAGFGVGLMEVPYLTSLLLLLGCGAVVGASLFRAVRARRLRGAHDPLIVKLMDPRTSAQAFEQILGRSDASQLFRAGLTMTSTPETMQGVELAQELSAEGLGRLKAVDAADALVPATRNAFHRVRKAAVQALGEIGDAAAVPALLEMLSSAELRLPAIRALGSIGDRSPLRHLIPFLGEGGLTLAVCEALAAMGEKDLADAFRRTLQGDETAVALLQQHEARIELVRALGAALTSNDVGVVVNAARALSSMGAVESLPDLRAAERSSPANEVAKRAIREAIGSLEALTTLPRTPAQTADTTLLPRAVVETTPERDTLPRVSG